VHTINLVEICPQHFSGDKENPERMESFSALTVMNRNKAICSVISLNKRTFMSPKRLSKITFWIGSNVRHLFRKIHIGLPCIFLCCLSQSILDIAVFPTSDHTASFSSFDSAPKTNILVQNEVPQHPRPVLVVW
jgi:hypothetical protein